MPDAAGAIAGCLPTPGQLLLLQAALRPAPQALEAWLRWEREIGLDRPDEGSHRLLPLVCRNLAGEASHVPQWQRLKGIHRLAWSRNQVLFNQVRPLIDELRRDGVSVLLLKGAALALRVYPDAGCRPMRDVDILVPATSARALLLKLESAGWKIACWRPPGFPESFFRFLHAAGFEAPDGARVDLHWHALNLCCHRAADDLFWSHSEPLDFLGIPVRTCSPTEHLLQICTHGIVWSPVPPVRWAADAVLLLRSTQPAHDFQPAQPGQRSQPVQPCHPSQPVQPDQPYPPVQPDQPSPAEAGIDWERLTRTACDLDLVPYLHSALAFLRRDLDAPVPDEVLDRLAHARASRSAAIEFARDADPPAPRTAWQDLLGFYSRWHRSLGGASPLVHPFGFVRHLQYAFEVNSAPALAGRLARAVVERLGRRRPVPGRARR